MADRRISNGVLLGPTGKVILDLTQSRPPFSGVGILDASGNMLLDLSTTSPKLPQANQGGPAGDLSAYPLAVGTDMPAASKANYLAATDPAYKLSAYPLVPGTDVNHDTAAGIGAISTSYGPGNASGQIPVSNGTVNTNLNAERWNGAKNDIVQASLTSPSTSSTSAVSTGVGVSLAPSSTRVLVRVNGTLANNTANYIVYAYIYRNTTGIPVEGASVGSDSQIITTMGTIAIANQNLPFSLERLDTGLTAGQTYYYYLAFAVSNGIGYIGEYTQGYMLAESR